MNYLTIDDNYIGVSINTTPSLNTYIEYLQNKNLYDYNIYLDIVNQNNLDNYNNNQRLFLILNDKKEIKIYDKINSKIKEFNDSNNIYYIYKNKPLVITNTDIKDTIKELFIDYLINIKNPNLI